MNSAPTDSTLFASSVEAGQDLGGNAVVAGRALVVLVTDAPARAEIDGRLVTELLAESAFLVDGVVSVPADDDLVRQALQTAVVGGVDLVITIGGTGVSPRDVVPEATEAVLDRRLPGIAEALRSSGLAANAVDACLSRGVVGISGSTIIANIAPSRAAIRDGMSTLLPLVSHVIADLSGIATEGY